MTTPKQSPFYKPPMNTGSSAPAEMNATEQIAKKTSEMLRQLELTEGLSKIADEKKEGFVPFPEVDAAKYHYGRTIFIPKQPLENGSIPPHSYNQGWGTGPKCNGPHCGIPVTPSMTGMQDALRMVDGIPPEALNQFPVAHRPGNSTDYISEYKMYTSGTSANAGPFRIKTSDF